MFYNILLDLYVQKTVFLPIFAGIKGINYGI